jgi:diaminopimelate decarboxylase
VARVGDLLCIRSAGAYGFAMSSNYNARPRAAEVLVDGDVAYLARARETVADLVRGERARPPGRRLGAREARDRVDSSEVP